MRNKVYISILLILSRILDLYTTLAFDIELNQETSPIVSIFNGNWGHLIIYNLIIVVLIIILYFLLDEKILENAENGIKKQRDFKNYLSILFYRNQVSFYELFTSKNFNIKLYFSLLLLCLPISFTIISFIVSIHNIIMIKLELSLIDNIQTQKVIYIIVMCFFIILTVTQLIYLKNRYNKHQR